MKALIFAWNIIGLANSLGIVNKSVVRSVNPQTYTTYCVYSEEEVSDNNLAQSKHVITCNSLRCEYYRRMCLNWGGAVGGANLIIGGYLLAPITGGLSLWITGLAAGSVSEILRMGLGQNLLAIENELKLKWENEQRERRINELRRELNETKRELAEAKEKRDDYYQRWQNTGNSANDWQNKYQEEKTKVEELERKVGELEIRLGDAR